MLTHVVFFLLGLGAQQHAALDVVMLGEPSVPLGRTLELQHELMPSLVGNHAKQDFAWLVARVPGQHPRVLTPPSFCPRCCVHIAHRV